MRYKRTDDKNNNGIDKTTWYIGSVEIIEDAEGMTEIKRYIGDAAIVTLHLNNNQTVTHSDTHYRHYDHLGSLDVITNANGAIVEELSFDPWGERRNGVNWSDLTATELAGFFDNDSTLRNGIGAHGITTRGFTGHEMLDEVGIVHMNGRIYDAKIARFLQADPIIQDPLNTQSLNRYSYTWNNPLNATDPSGYVTIISGDALRSLGGATLGDVFGWNSSSTMNTFAAMSSVFGSLGSRVIPKGSSLASFSAGALTSASEDSSEGGGHVARGDNVSSDGNDHKWNEIDAIQYFFENLFNSNPAESSLAEFKDAWVKDKKEAIKKIAEYHDIPPEMLAGIAWTEVGGDPDDQDIIVHDLRSMGLISGDPLNTSFGDVQIQLRNVAKALNVDPESLNYGGRVQLIKLMQNENANLNVVARHIGEAMRQEYDGLTAADYTDEHIRAAGYMYNIGYPHPLIGEGKDLSEISKRGISNYGDDLLGKMDKMRGFLE
ncbi:RHS repeat domain-containing protein [Porticoccus sp. GXU_MW_L64]